MLRSVKELEGYTVSATDGEVGKTVDVLVDDDRWTVRYLIVEAGGSLFSSGQRVLISPVSFRKLDWSARRFDLSLTKEKIKNSPSIDVDQPVSRQHEHDYFSYYGYPLYWGFGGVWGMGAYPQYLSGEPLQATLDRASESGDQHLRSARELRGYHIQGSDDSIGHVEDLLVDDESWQVRYLSIATSNWWFGKNVLVAPQWSTRVSWADKKVFLNLARQTIKNSPEWTSRTPVDRDYEIRLHQHYGQEPYWAPSSRAAPIAAAASHQETMPKR